MKRASIGNQSHNFCFTKSSTLFNKLVDFVGQTRRLCSPIVMVMRSKAIAKALRRLHPFWRICNSPAVSIRIFNPKKAVITYFGHFVGIIALKMLILCSSEFLDEPSVTLRDAERQIRLNVDGFPDSYSLARRNGLQGQQAHRRLHHKKKNDS